MAGSARSESNTPRWLLPVRGCRGSTVNRPARGAHTWALETAHPARDGRIPVTNPQNESQALGDLAARQLANATKTNARAGDDYPLAGSPDLLQWVPVEAGIYRVNRVTPTGCRSTSRGESDLDGPPPQTYVDYARPTCASSRPSDRDDVGHPDPRPDPYSSPHNQGRRTTAADH